MGVWKRVFLSENKESFGIKFDENLFLYVHRFNHVFSTKVWLNPPQKMQIFWKLSDPGYYQSWSWPRHLVSFTSVRFSHENVLIRSNLRTEFSWNRFFSQVFQIYHLAASESIEKFAHGCIAHEISNSFVVIDFVCQNILMQLFIASVRACYHTNSSSCCVILHFAQQLLANSIESIS